MSDTELKKQYPPVQGAAEERQPQGEVKDISKLLSSFGGFNAVRGFLPDADNLNPARKAAKAVFLSDKRFKEKRENLANDIKAWLEMLDEGHNSATEFVDSCKEKEEKYTNVLSQGITDALYATANLERSYRSLDAFFKTANTDKVKNLRIINVYKDDIADNDSLLQIVADYQLIKQNIQDSISAKRHYIQSLEDFTVAETFLSAQDSVYEKFHTDALEYSLIKQLAPQLEQLKGKEQILFAEIQEHYEKAKAAAEEFNELQPRINKIEQRYIDLKNTSDKIQALEYKPWFQRIKDYLFGLAAVSMILLFVNALQSKIQMLKQTRENAKKLKQMQNKEEDDYPSI